MTIDASADILAGIHAYLREHFPEGDLVTLTEATTHSVILHGTGDPPFRLEVPERFLDGEDGAAPPLRWVRE